MHFPEHPVCPQTCVWYMTRTTDNLNQNEHTKLELCSNYRPTIQIIVTRCCHTLPADSRNLAHGVELLFETNSANCLYKSNSYSTVRAAQRKHKISHQNVPPAYSKSRFPLMCSTLALPTLFPMNFLGHIVCSQTCMWCRTRSTNNLDQNELMKRELCPNNRTKIINNFGPTLSHLARWFSKSRAWYAVTLRDKLCEPLVQIEFVLDSARSATATPNPTPKCDTKSLETAISAHMTNLAVTHKMSNEFSGPPRVFSDLRMVQDSHHKQPQPKRFDETRVMPK